jgi:ectoine hydroxylase-related dioxygenase (phytanoyl-CoA dioxygenase family)
MTKAQATADNAKLCRNNRAALAAANRITKLMETNSGREKLGMPPLLERDDWIPQFPGDKPPLDRGFKGT